ncbi:hypothetical protein CPB83DRAFT_865560, partial [Crepidotus variabilis]
MGITQSKRLRLRKSKTVAVSLHPDLLLEPDRHPMAAFSRFYKGANNSGDSFQSGITRNRSISSINSMTDSSGSRSYRSRSQSPSPYGHPPPVMVIPQSSPPLSWQGGSQHGSAMEIVPEDITYHPQDLKGILEGVRFDISSSPSFNRLFQFGDALQALLDTALFTGEDLRLLDTDSNVDNTIPNSDPKEPRIGHIEKQEREKIVIGILDLMFLMTQTYTQDYDSHAIAESLLQRIKLERTRLFGTGDAMVSSATGGLAVLYYEQRRWAEAEVTAAEFVGEDRGTLEKWDSKILFFFAKLYIRQGKWVEVEPVLEELDSRTGLPEVIGQAGCLESLLDAYIAQEKWSKVRELAEKHEYLKDRRRMDRIMALIGQENWVEAKRAIRRDREVVYYIGSRPIAYPVGQRRREPRSHHMLALIYLGQQRWERAESKFSGGIGWDRWQRAIRKSNWRHDDWRNLRGARGLCEAYMGMNKDGEAERLLLQVIEGSKSALGDEDVDTLD